MPWRPPPAQPARLGRYRLLAEIARGGVGAVYAGCADMPIGFRKIVALKTLRPDLAAEPALVRMLIEEARLASRLQHPHIAQLYDLGDDGGPFLVMEYVHGEALSAVLASAGALAPRIGVWIATCICDALAYAVESKPDLLVDLATLTGAARVALGPELPALFSNNDDLAQSVLAAGRAQQDPLWQLPLWQPYTSMLDSRLADLVNAGASRHAGAITAALFLQRFVPATTPWLHMDAYAWNDSDRPGRPQGGEAQGLRAMFAAVEQRYPRV